MLQINDTLVSLDLAEQYFCCDLDSCLGECCIEGDAGAPITEEERDKIQEILPVIWDDLLPQAQAEIKANGVGYVDEEGDLVTSIVDGKNCVFTCYAPGGMCQCAIEKAYRAGKIDFYSFFKELKEKNQNPYLIIEHWSDFNRSIDFMYNISIT